MIIIYIGKPQKINGLMRKNTMGSPFFHGKVYGIIWFPVTMTSLENPSIEYRKAATGAMELYPRDTDDMRVVLETGHVRRKTSATGVTWKIYSRSSNSKSENTDAADNLISIYRSSYHASYQAICLSIYLSVCLSIYLPI